MAHAVSSPPILRLKRSAQSGTKTMAAAYVAVYSDSSSMAYYFAGANINLSGMLAGDVVNIRVRTMIVRAGVLTPFDLVSYSNAQPVGHQVAHIAALPDVYGVEIAMQQTAGVLLNIETEFFDAKRLGLT